MGRRRPVAHFACRLTTNREPTLERAGHPSQVGAGIVADSQPDLEYKETLQKGQSMLSALDIANAWVGNAQA
ncbi:MAG: chorismate-binding protein [Planctomycetes bacterium]|nr:chorismate-binding protein [Planctomycetota bacterium]